MLLETLIVVDSWLEGNRLAEEESITYLYPWHEIIITSGMSQLYAATQIQTILLDIITSLGTDREIILQQLARIEYIFAFTI